MASDEWPYGVGNISHIGIIPLDHPDEVHPKFALQSLPEELLDAVLELLPRRALFDLSLTSRWGYTRAAGHIWKDVVLADKACWRLAPPGRTPPLRRGVEHGEEVDVGAEHPGQIYDDHDETPMLKKLFILATNPFVASKVQTVLHRCHLPQPELFNDLPRIMPEGLIHSRHFLHDHRRNLLSKLILQAVANMVNVHTLKVVFGHWAIVETLLMGFFGPRRRARVPVRKLWLESCSISTYRYQGFWLGLNAGGVKSLRLRRMWLMSESHRGQVAMARGTNTIELRNQTAGYHVSSTVTPRGDDLDSPNHTSEYLLDLSFRDIVGQSSRAPPTSWLTFTRYLAPHWSYQGEFKPQMQLWLKSQYSLHAFDSILNFLGPVIEPLIWPPAYGEQLFRLQWRSTISAWWNTGSAKHFSSLFYILRSATNLTSLSLDWVMSGPGTNSSHGTQKDLTALIQSLRLLSFPNLRAFQLRNAISEYTQLQERVWLLDSGYSEERTAEWWQRTSTRVTSQDTQSDDMLAYPDVGLLDFMERHPNLQCLAWPMDSFFPPRPTSPAIADRIRNVVANLGRTLLDLRVDYYLSAQGEPMTDDNQTSQGLRKRIQRRRFISEFAAEMRTLQSIKIEGGVPRDEKREIARALSHCPLSKLVYIGASFPLANTWGQDGADLNDIDEGGTPYVTTLEEEDKKSIEDAVKLIPVPETGSASKFRSSYGWRAGNDPMLYTIARYHCSTIKELKFCGYSGSPVLKTPTPITHPLLHHLRYFKELRELVMSFWLLTFYDHDHRDEIVINYWLDMRKPTSKALAVVHLESPDRIQNPDEQSLQNAIGSDNLGALNEPLTSETDAAYWLYNNFHPLCLANQVAKFIGPHLAKEAKERPGGVRVRASFCLGTACQDIFDFDVRIGSEDKVLGYVGPREDSWDGGRAEEKLRNRRWF